MNAVLDPQVFPPMDKTWVRCGWRGEIERVEGMPCPRCGKVGVLSPVVDVPKP